MESLTNFINEIINSLSNLDIAKLYDFEYLTEVRPESFTFSGLFTLLVIVDFLVVGVLYILLNRRVLVLLGKRKLILRKAMKYNLIFSILWLVFIFARFQGVLYLSMRIWHLLFLILLFGVNLYFGVKFLMSKKVEEGTNNSNEGFNYYQDYLPKKNKKRKH
jgi:hypothetical protein